MSRRLPFHIVRPLLCAGLFVATGPGCSGGEGTVTRADAGGDADARVLDASTDTSDGQVEDTAPPTPDSARADRDTNIEDAAIDAGQPDVGDPDAPLDDELKAFPGAVGFGRNATGGRGGRIVEVTNLNDSGPGSLRAALDETGPRTVVFRVGGTIQAGSYLTIGSDNGDVTIAGQTAPGDGIAIRGAELRILASNVIVRHLRVRPGDQTTGSNEDGIRVIAYSGRLVEDVIIDHCSVTWAKDEVLAIGGIGDGSRVRNVTVQNSIIGQNTETQYGLLLWQRSTDITVYGNLFAHNKERNIRASTCGSSFEMVNNVVYSYTAATRPTYENAFRIVGNVYSTNPTIQDSFETVRLEASTNNCPNGQIDATQAYLADNILDGGEITVSNNLASRLLNAPPIDSGLPVMPAAQVFDAVLGDVGANVPSNDAADQRLFEQARNRTGGYVSSVAQAGGYPDLADGTPYPDADGDGMDDAWEVTRGLDPQAADGADDRNGDGYTNLEEFLHYLTTVR